MNELTPNSLKPSDEEPAFVPLVRTQQEAFAAGLTHPPMMYGDSIRETNPRNYPAPTALYLIYYTVEADGTPSAVHLTKSNVTDRRAAELELYKLARDGDPGVGRDFENIVWREPTYVSIVLNVDGHEFYWFDPMGYDPIVFVPRKEISVEGPELEMGDYEQNKSFYDAEKDTFADPDDPKKILQVLRFTNYHRNGAGNELSPLEIARFCMNIQLIVTYKGGKKKWKHIIDPDTQNQGPGGGPTPRN